MKIIDTELQTVCKSVTFDNTKRNLDLIHKLLRLMRKENGIGLAANQCGIDLRVFVMSVNGKIYHCFNPEILEFSKETIELDEGCLSYPGQYCKILRPSEVLVRYYSAGGELTEQWLSGLVSRCFQHELDHLNAITMFTRVSNNKLTIQESLD